MISFTQYLLPNGRREQVEIERPADVEAAAQAVIEAGGKFECEILTTGHVSLTAVHEVDGEQQDFVIIICKNDEGIPDAVDRLVLKASKWLKERESV